MSLPQDKNDYIDGSISGINDDDENNNSNHVAHNGSNINNSAFIATDDYYSTSSSDKSERNKSIEVSVVFASEDYNSKNNDDSIIIKSSPTVAKKKKKKKKKNSSSNANRNNEKVNPSSVRPQDKEEEKEEEGGGGCNNKEVAVLVLPPGNKNAVDCNINTNNGGSSTIIGKSNNDILGIVHSSDSISEEGRDNNGGRNKNVAEQPVLYNNKDDCSSSTFSSKPYPADTYSLLSLHGPVGNPGFFSYGLMVYLFQMTFLVLMVLSVIHPKWSSNGDVDNPDGDSRGSLLERLAEFVPSHVSPLVRATQITATLSYIIFADSTVLDVVTAVELFPRFNQATSEDKLGCMVFASILRLSQGILAITVTLLLIVTSSTTIEIILNFTAINFISTLDNVGFEIIKWGKYGPKFEEEAKRIEKLPLPRCLYRKYEHVRYLCTIIPIGVILFSMICSMIILQESNNDWVTEKFRVQFQDKEQGLQVYNGCYEKNETAIDRKEGFGRKLYESFEYNSESAKFGYCIEDRRWILFNGDNTTACEARGNDNELARSTKTDTFDVSTMFEEQWYTSSNTPLDLSFIEENGDIELNMTTCSSFINDGDCNSFFNKFDFQYDGGDCCAATCSRPKCGIGSLKNAFNTTNATGNGFPDCTDPNMVPITIRLDNIVSSFEPQFQDDDCYFCHYGFNKSSTIDDILRNSIDDDSLSIERLRKDPIKPLLFIDCDGSNVLNIYVDKSMDTQTETIMVSDGADCTMTILNDADTITVNDDDSIWYADYTILHGDKQSNESNSIEIAQASSAKKSTYNFRRIPECYLDKLSNYIDRSTVYTGIDNDPTAKAINWLMNDESENSICEDPFFLERYALAVIYFAAYNSRDYILNSTTKQCVWPSIICEEGTVISLDMKYKELNGTIPSEIKLMTSLTSLDLSVTGITGTIPSEIGLMTSLKIIYLDDNDLTGTIPSEIGLMTSLTNLYLDHNDLTGTIPSEIGLMTSLTSLNLNYNRLTGSIPSEIRLMTSLVYLNLINGNAFTGSIPGIFNGIISTSYENLNGTIPSEIGLMTSLTSLDLYSKNITGSIPSEIGLMTSLEFIDLYSNELNGTIPSEIGLMTSLTSLDLYNNALTGTIPSEIGLMTSLENLYLYDNALNGTIPSEIGLMTSLTSLDLGGNAFSGSIPSEIEWMTSLYDFNFDSNFSNGTTAPPAATSAPPGVTILPNPLVLNELNGTIPSEIGLMTSLTSLDLYSKNITGSIPSEIGLMTSLTIIYLDYNDLTGTIPSEIGLLTYLTGLSLNNNDLTGSIPSEIGQMTSLTYLILSNNALTGTIPSEIGLLTSLEYLYLNNNALTSTIPSEIGLMTSLTSQDFGGNAFTATTPPATFTAPPATFTAPPATFTAPPATFTAPPAATTATDVPSSIPFN